MHQNVDLLQQTTMLCQTVQHLGKQMQDVQNLGCRMVLRLKVSEDKMTTMSGQDDDRQEGRRLQERTTGQTQLAQNEIMKGLKNEENARQMVQMT